MSKRHLPSKSSTKLGPSTERAVGPGVEGPSEGAAEVSLASSQAGSATASADPVDAATSGGGEPLPFLSTLEERFGTPLSHIRAHVGRPQVLAAGALALSRGHDVAFAEASPDLETVAEEVAHTFQPASGGQAVSDPNDPSEDEAAAAAAAIARGEHVDPGELGTPGAEVQRVRFLPTMLGAVALSNVTFAGVSAIALTKAASKHDLFSSDTQGPFGWDGAGPGAELPPMSLVQPWTGPAWVVSCEDREAWVAAREAQCQPTALPGAHRGIPVRSDVDQAAVDEGAAKERARVVGMFVAALEGASTVPDAIAELNRVMLDATIGKFDRPKPAKASIGPAGGAPKVADYSAVSRMPLDELLEEPKIWNHKMMLQVQQAEPQWLLGFAARLDPLPQLKRILRAADPKSPLFWDSLTAWCRRHPASAAKATSDPEIATLIQRSSSVLGSMANANDLDAEKKRNKATSKADKLVAGTNEAIDSWLADGALHAFGDEDGTQLRILQILSSGGVESADPGPALQRAISDGDAAAFERAWDAVVRDAGALAKYRLDTFFVVRVEQRLGAQLADRVRIDLRSGANEGPDDELSDPERQKVRELATQYAGPLSRLISPVVYTWGADDTLVMAQVRAWGDAVRAELRDRGGKVHPKRLLQAQVILHRAFNDLSGKELCDRLKAHLGKGPFDEALGIVGAQSAILAAEQQAGLGIPDSVAAATKRAAKDLDPMIAPVAYTGWNARDAAVLAILQTWRAEVDGSIPDGPDAQYRRAEAQQLLHSAFTGHNGKDLMDRLAAHLDAAALSTASRLVGSKAEIRAALDVETGPYTASLSDREQQLVDSIVRATAKRLHDEFSEIYTDDADVLALLEDMQRQLREALCPPSDDPDAVRAYLEKVTTASHQIRQAFLAFGSLEEEMADHVWDSATRRRCQMIAGTRHVPVDAALVDELLAAAGTDREGPDADDAPFGLGALPGAKDERRPSPTAIAEALPAIQFKILDLAEELDKGLHGAAAEDAVAASAGKLAGIRSETIALTPEQRTKMLVDAYQSIGGDLGSQIRAKFKDPAKADAVCQSLGLVGKFGPRGADAHLVAQLDILKAVHENFPGPDRLSVEGEPSRPAREPGRGVGVLDRDADLNDVSLDPDHRALTGRIAQLEDQVRTLSRLAGPSVALFEAITKAPRTTPTAGEAVLTKAVAAVTAVEGWAARPVRFVEGLAGDDEAPTLLHRQYAGMGITLDAHIGTLPRDLQAPITNALGRSVSPTTAERAETRTADDGKLVITPELTGIARELEPSINYLDARPDFSGERALAQAHAIRELISATIAAMRGELHRPRTAADVAISAGTSALAIVALGISAPLIARGLDNAARENLKAKLHHAVAEQLGMNNEAQVVRAAYQRLYGESIEFGLRTAFGATDPTAQTMIDRVQRAKATIVTEITAFTASKDIDAIYARLFEATDAERAEVLAAPACLTALRGLGRKAYDRIYQTLKGQLTLREMIRSRDGDSDDYDYILTEAWGKTARKWGFGEDSAKMEADVALFLSAWKKKAEAALPDPGDDDAVKKAQKEQVSAQFKAYCQEILDDKDLRAAFETSLSERERMKMLLLIGDGGTLSATSKVMVDVTGWGTQDGILDNIKAMSDAERAAAVKDPTFMLRVIQDLRGDEQKAALAYLHGKKADDKLADAQSTLDDQGLFAVDQKKAMQSVLGLDHDALVALSKDPLRLARFRAGLNGANKPKALPRDGIFEDRAHVFDALIADLQGLETRNTEAIAKANARDLAASKGGADEAKAITSRNEAIFKKRDTLHLKHKYALLNAAFGGAEDLATAAAAAYAERGEMGDPNSKDAKLYVWNQQARDALWAEVAPQINELWRDQFVDMAEHYLGFGRSPWAALGAAGAVGVGGAVVAFLGLPLLLVGGLAGGAYALMDGARDMDGNRASGTWAEVVELAVTGRCDPAVTKIAKQQELSRDDAGIVKSIASAGSDLVIERWSNIVQGGADGRSLSEVARACWLARALYEQEQNKPDRDDQWVEKLRKEAQIKLLAYRAFRIAPSAEVEAFLSDRWKGAAGYVTGASESQMLTYREAVIDRILALSPEEIAVELGLGEFVEDDLTGVRTFQRNERVTVGAGGETTAIDEQDVSSLMNESRKMHAKAGLMDDKAAHQIDGWSLVDGYSDKKSAIGEAQGGFKLDYYRAMSQTDEERAAGVAGDITDAEAKALEKQLARVGKTITDYKKAKSDLANRLKMVAATVIAVATALVSGPAGPSLVASLMIGAGEAALMAVIDEACQGNDYDLVRELGPAIAKGAATKLFQYGMDRGFADMANAWPKTAAFVKDNPVSRFALNTKAAVESVPGGDLLVAVFQKGIVAPALDVATAPLLHLIDPNELKWGTRSASQEAWDVFESKLAALPETMWVKSIAAMKKGATDKLIATLTEKNPEAKDLPGIKVDEKKLPKPEDLLTSFRTVSKKQWGELMSTVTDLGDADKVKAQLIKFLVEGGAIVLDGGDPQAALAAHFAKSKVGQLGKAVHAGMKFADEGYTGDNLLFDVFDVVYPHIGKLIVSTAKDYTKTRNAHRAHEYLENNKDKLDQIELPDGVSREQAEAFFGDYLRNRSKGAAVDDADFLAFKKERWPQVKAALQGAQLIKDAEQRERFVAWLLEDPESFDKRTGERTAFVQNMERGDAWRAQQQAALEKNPALAGDRQAWGSKMLSPDNKASAVFDYAKGTGKSPDLTKREGVGEFNASYVKMKQDAVIAACDDFKKAAKYQTRWVAFVRARSSASWWSSTHPFGPGESAESAAAALAREFRLSFTVAEMDELASIVYPNSKRGYHANPSDTYFDYDPAKELP